ncbi:hypothetical protein AB1N83_014212, partial [Pleurotus pulmonarius]
MCEATKEAFERCVRRVVSRRPSSTFHITPHSVSPIPHRTSPDPPSLPDVFFASTHTRATCDSERTLQLTATNLDSRRDLSIPGLKARWRDGVGGGRALDRP